ncbi:MAG: EAL domain-containing protein [Oscillospiraceae bacterium]|nr:EAL domain-containing protein [Oscillospiraceae bacterium]
MAILDGLKKYFKMLPAQLTIVNKKAAEIAGELYRAAIESRTFADNEAFHDTYEHRLEKYIIYYDIGKYDMPCSEIRIDHTPMEHEMQANRKTMALLEEIFRDAKLTGEEQICKEILYCAIERNEQFDGMGFPNCLKGPAISPVGRILCVADYIARQFIDCVPKDDLLKNLRLKLGKRFDPDVVLLANGVVEQLYEAVREQLPKEGDELLSIQMLYQPVFDAPGNMSIENAGYICLNDPKKGVLMPSFYGPIAERNGRMMDITKYGFELLFRDMANSKLAGPEVSRNFSVGVSLECLSKASFLQFLKKLIRDFSVNPRRLIFEIDASSIELNDMKLPEILSGYRELGIKVAMDNYGIDNASLSKLQDTEFDIIKLDRSFTDKICGNRKTYEIVKNMIKMAQDLKIAVIAKGVDNEQQKVLLQDLSCFYMQGRLFGEPAYFSI